MPKRCRARGCWPGLAPISIWGLLPLYLKLLTGIEAGEVLAQRIIWSVVIVAALVLVTGGGRAAARGAGGNRG